MTSDAPRESDFDADDELLQRALEAFELGGDDAVDELCRAHADRAPALRRRIALLARAGLWSSGAGATPVDAPPERLGEFRLERVLGAGGMGVVYLAVQEPLGRRVALKIVRPEHLFFPGARERFRREVETIARLQHPGIVPVYTVGEHQGVPYFAMEYIAGRTLAVALAAVHGRGELRGADLAFDGITAQWLFAGTWEDACLRIVRQVAEALEHAHQRGILHRDLKPSNILLTDDGTSRVLLFDFGLASGASDSTLTRTGSRVGSLPYMSPEQARGDLQAIDARSDVYSLGVTLYELLTRQRAFRGDSEVELLRAVQNGERRSPRELDPTLSIEAETVCSTAMDPDPARRYASAADFARDLANVLERRPIEAQRASPWLVARRWVQRRPALATALLLALVLIVVGPSIWIWQVNARAADLHTFNTDLAAQLAATRAAERSAVAESERARRSASHARDAINQFLVKVGDEYLESVPRADALRVQLLDDGTRLYEELLADEPDNPQLRADVAVVLRMLGERYASIGREESAARCSDRSLELLRGLHVGAPENWGWKLLLAKTLGERGTQRGEQGVADPDAEAEVREALGLLEELVAARPDEEEALRDRAIVTMTLAILRGLAGANAEALALLRRAAEVAETVVERDPAFRTFLLTVQCNLAARAGDLGLVEEARESYARALATAQRAFVDSPSSVESRHATAAIELNFATFLRGTGSIEDGLEHADAAIERFEALARDFPTQFVFLRGLAEACAERSRFTRVDPTSAVACAERADATFERVVAAAPDDARARETWVFLLHEVGLARLERGEPAAAVESLTRAVEQSFDAAQRFGVEAERDELFALLCDVLDARTLHREFATMTDTLALAAEALFPDDVVFAHSLACGAP